VCELLEELEPDNKLRVFLLDSFNGYMKIYGSVIKINQNIILNAFDQFKSLLYLLNDAKELEKFID
jgi:hypothetical protein